ncbi:MAG: alpha/beta hydrolase fold domain-containing protein [Limisphaerales bacterium]
MKNIIFGALLLILPSLLAQTKVLKNLKFAEIDSHELKLDLYLPKTQNPPLVVWVHGGAWRAGSKSRMPLKDLVPQGFAVASVDYRLTPVAPFPANVHDIKAAIRWLRGNSTKYGFNAKKIGIAGASAGGHLVNLVGTSNGHRQLEGKIGEHRDQSSDVAAILSFYGAANLMTILHQSTPHGLSVRVPALKLLLGGEPNDKPTLAKLASPVFHVDANDPPLLLIHGVQDHQMPVNQSIELYLQYREKKLPVHFEFIPGGGHGGPQFYDAKRIKMTAEFFRKHLK